MDTRDFGPFLTVQCDVCGTCLPDAPLDDATLNAWLHGDLRVARMDYPAYCHGVDALLREVLAPETHALGVFVAALHAASHTARQGKAGRQ